MAESVGVPTWSLPGVSLHMFLNVDLDPVPYGVHGGCISWMLYLCARLDVSIFTICSRSAQVWKNQFSCWWCLQRATVPILHAPQKYQKGSRRIKY